MCDALYVMWGDGMQYDVGISVASRYNIMRCNAIPTYTIRCHSAKIEKIFFCHNHKHYNVHPNIYNLITWKNLRVETVTSSIAVQ